MVSLGWVLVGHGHWGRALGLGLRQGCGGANYINLEFRTKTRWWTLILLYYHGNSAVRCRPCFGPLYNAGVEQF